MSSSVDVAVIGRGLIGSAAGRHLAESGVSTALVGPGEPEDRTTSPGPFSSHADEGRITRIAGRTMIWSDLAARSIARYRDLELRSGITFHTMTGLAVALPTVDDWIDAGLINGSNIRKVEADWLREKTGIAVTNGHPIAFEGKPAGHINPRRLVAAQSKLAALAGATVIDHAVTALDRTEGGFELTGGWGSLTARRILLATGAFGRGLLEQQLVVERRARSVVMGEMADPGGIPSLILADPPDSRLEDIYWVPPVQYPDGRLCLKIGGTVVEDRTVDSEDELTDWFHTGGYDLEIDALQTSLRSLLPDVSFTSFTSSPCVITATASDYPYLGYIDDGVAVAIGGNGAAAKSSDELGRLAASLFSDDGWTDSLDAETFAPQLR
ncbi:MAG: FAD-binding oxidoreductase [Acidimicrobiia bacterium]|nr:FAD-binding oxidoreductase [Acidimicrobiia bacterium]